MSTPASESRSRLPAVYESWLPREHSLFRPRHASKQLLALVCAVVFFSVPVLSGVFVRPHEIENHHLAGFPTPGSDWSLFTGLGPWATDHLPLRGQAIDLGDAISRGVFGEAPALGGNEHNDQNGPLQTGQQPTTPDIAIPNVVEGNDGWMYLGEEFASPCRRKGSLDDTMFELGRLHDGVVASGRQFVVLIAPDKATVEPTHLPASYPGKACHDKASAEFWQRMTTLNYVVDVRAGLMNKSVYQPLDAHWGDEGAVQATRSVVERLQPGLTASWQVTPTRAWQSAADLPPLIGKSGVTRGQHYAVQPDGVTDQTRQVPTDFTRPLRLGTATGPGTFQRSVGMLGDSFTIRALPYLAAAFGDLTVLHFGDVAKDQGQEAASVLVENDAVVIEVAERNLDSGDFALLSKPVVDRIVHDLNAQPIR